MYNTHEAKTQFSSLLKKVLRGEEVIIAHRGEPIVRMIAMTKPKKKKNSMGVDKGLFKVPKNFNDPLPDDVLQEFYK